MDSGTTVVNWQQAFESYSIPQTRAIEKQLRSNAAQNKEKLRTLVGYVAHRDTLVTEISCPRTDSFSACSGSYRELLATAQAIVVLDEETRVAENHLSKIGHDCRPSQLNTTPRPPPIGKVALAQYRLLQRCCTTLASSLRTNDLLQCARLTVVSRLLLKSLGDMQTAIKNLDFLRNKLSSLRRNLLLRLESRLINPTSRLSDLLESICSYCLVTSSSAEDALAYLRQLRLKKIRHLLTASHKQATICEALRYQLLSLQTFRSLLGRPIVEAMNELQKRPILLELGNVHLESLDLDRIISLIPSDIRSFVPYFKRIASSSEEMQSKFETWSEQVCRVSSDALRQCLSGMVQLDEVTDIRRQLYTLLLPFYFSTPAGSHIKEQIAHAINEKVSAICQRYGAQLNRSTSLLLDHQATGRPTGALWDDALALSTLDAGGEKLIRQVKKRHTGQNAASSKASKTLSRWTSTAKTTLDQLDEMSKTRWRDVLEEPDEENEDEAVALIRTLSETEPRLFKEALQVALHQAVLKHDTSVAEAVRSTIDTKGDILPAVALLRSIRLSMSSLQSALPEHAKFERLQEIVPQLQQMIANEVAEQLSQTVSSGKKPESYEKGMLPERMPSPRAFATLRRLCKIMMNMGGADLWSPPTINLVKQAVGCRIFDPESKGLCIENEFDDAYLSTALGRTSGENAQDGQISKELAKSASEYWARTKLLFGVLG
ncbi:hypothetical protein H2200_012139 [Cladophialophora chaetospira]|uniref:Conserved oligomeric Golgi complex subunit 1 n=1 Tax=Cladophialophora chaetospira TaxID=386627 RepID=A0AA38WYC2_9EURO|nr:hypothetical protein H2200_012139 [Cladophialophora chaetospira]